MRQLPLGVMLRANAVFANFAPGANAEILAALEGSGRDPLWLWGGRGCGKTHLVRHTLLALDDGVLPVPVEGGMYEGQLSALIDRSVERFIAESVSLRPSLALRTARFSN